MVRLTVNLPAELADRMRDAVYWTPGLTIAWFVASAIRTSLAELETLNRTPFPKRARQLRPGAHQLHACLHHLADVHGRERGGPRAPQVRTQ